MRLRLRVSLSLFCILITVAHRVWAEALKMDMRTTVQYAVENAPTLEVSRRQMAISDMQRKNAYSVFLPQLDLSSQHGISDRNPQVAGNNKYVSQLGVTLSENLYDNGISFIKYDSAKITKTIAELSYANDRDKLALSIISQFLQYSLVVRLLEVQKAQYDIVNKQFKSISTLYEQGIKTRRDFLRFKSELRRSQINLQSANTQVETTKADLVKLIAPTEIIKNTEFSFNVEPVNLELVKSVPKEKPNLDNHWLFQIARLRSGVFSNDVSIARRSYWPQFFLNGDVSYASSSYWKTGSSFADNDYTAWNALLTVKFNLWDWGIRNRNITIAKDQKIQQEKTIESSLNEFIASNEKLMLNMGLSHNNFLTNQELLGLETESYAFLENEYRNGRATYLDLIIGLRDLLNAKIQLFSSYYSLRTLLFQYQYHEGKLYEFFQ